MKIDINKYTYFVNEKYGVSLPILKGYEDDYKREINEINNYKTKEINIFDKDYYYESVNISLNITKNCNLACKYCFNKNKENKRMDYDTAVKFIDKVIELTPNAERYVIDLSGSGEPLIEIDTILELVDYCYNKSNEINKYIMPQFVCNGTLLTKDIVKKLQDKGVIFGISIDGTKKIHDKNRVFRDGSGSFDKIISNIEAIEHKEYLGCAVTLSNNNIKILDDVKFLSKYFNTIAIKIVRPNIFEKLDYKKINKEYDKLAIYMLKEFKQGKIDTLKRLLNGDDFFGKYLFRIIGNGSVQSRCDGGVGKFALDFDNNIYTCSGAVGIEKLKLGTLDSTIDLDLGKSLQAKTQDNDICNKCKYKRLCGGECMVVSSLNDGVLNDMCEIKKHLIQLSLFIKGELMFFYDDLLSDIFAFLEEKGSRSFGDKDLTNLANKNIGYTFMELKKLKDDNDPLYFKLLKKYKIK